MEDVQLRGDALNHVAYWASTQPWFPREASSELVFTDEIRLPRAGARILFARSGSYAFIIPVAISAREHPASFALVNDRWLIDGLEHTETLQDLLDAASGHVHTACLRGSGSARLRTDELGDDWHLSFRRVLRGDTSIEGQLHDALYTGGSVAMPQVLTRLTADWFDGGHPRVSEFMLIRERWRGERSAVEVLAEAAASPCDLAPATSAARRIGEVITVLHDADGDTSRAGASRSLHIVETALASANLPNELHAWLSAECERFRHMQSRMRPSPTLPGLTVDSMLLADDSAGFFDLASDYRGEGLNADDVGRIAFGIVCIAENASEIPLTDWVIATIGAFASGARLKSPAELVSMRIAMIAEALSVLHGQPTLAIPRNVGQACARRAANRTLDYLAAHGAVTRRRQTA